MSKDSYLLPAELEPLDDFCAKVYIPDNDVYRRAFLGAYIAFGTWVVWERDREHRATVAAARWRDAIEKTLLEWGNGCGCADEDDMTQEEVTALIKEILDAMTITITNTNNCGCGCGGTGTGGTGTSDGDVDYRIPPPSEPPTEPPAEPPVAVNPDNSQKCSMANYLVYTLRLTLLRVQENGGNYPDFSTWYEALFYPVTTAVYDIAYQTWQWAKQWFTGNQTDVSAVFDQYYNTYVCSLFSATTAQMAQGNLLAVLGGSLVAYEDLSYTARLIAAELPFGLLFAEAGSVEIPVGFSNLPCCGESQVPIEPLPELPANSGYRLVPFVADEVSDIPNNNSADVTYNEPLREFTHIALNTGLNYHETDVSLKTNNLISRTGFTSVHGLVFQFTSSTLTGDVAVRLSTSTGGTQAEGAVVNKQIAYYQNDEYVNVPAFAAFVDAFTNKLTYGNGVMSEGNKNGFRSQSYTNSISPSFKVRVWAICKE